MSVAVTEVSSQTREEAGEVTSENAERLFVAVPRNRRDSGGDAAAVDRCCTAYNAYSLRVCQDAARERQ